MSADKLSARELAKRLEDHAATHEIIFGKQFRSEEERQAAAELRRLDASEAALLQELEAVVSHFTKTPSTLADSTVRGAAHMLIARVKEARNG